jgi:hypothetical protein
VTACGGVSNGVLTSMVAYMIGLSGIFAVPLAIRAPAPGVQPRGRCRLMCGTDRLTCGFNHLTSMDPHRRARSIAEVPVGVWERGPDPTSGGRHVPAGSSEGARLRFYHIEGGGVRAPLFYAAQGRSSRQKGTPRALAPLGSHRSPVSASPAAPETGPTVFARTHSRLPGLAGTGALATGTPGRPTQGR